MSKTVCKNCGAPVTSDVCPYCNNKVEKEKETVEHVPTIECKEVNLSFWTIAFPAIFAVSFGFFGFGFPFLFNSLSDGMAEVPFVFCIPFATISIVAFIFIFVPIIRFITIKAHGREIEGTVHHYMNDNVMLNDAPAQIAVIHVETDDGPKYIKYQLGKADQPYEINSKITLLVYKDIFYIKPDKKYYFEGK